jgi:hypothetical protein
MNTVLSRRSLLLGAGSTLVGWLAWLTGGLKPPRQSSGVPAMALASPPAPRA